MSHFSVLVVTEKKPDEKLLHKLFAPYEENGENEKQKWDWYQVGGRWTGHLSDYDPEKDPSNMVACKFCKGTGMRNDEVGIEARSENPSYTCNSCDGKGEHLKWPTNWVPCDQDSIQVKDLSKNIEPTFAILKDGEWLERGEMGWFAMVSNKKDKDEWQKQFNETLKALPKNNWLTIVDCHI